jgi:hypothetical protein
MRARPFSCALIPEEEFLTTEITESTEKKRSRERKGM